MKKLALDTYYWSDSLAKTVGVVFNNWSDSEPIKIITDTCTTFGPYIPGKFYIRELPCVLGLLTKIDISEFDTLITDSFLRLRDSDGNDSDGLGMKLYEALGKPEWIDIWSIAKTEFGKCHEISCPVLRGEAINPIYVQALKVGNQKAGEIVRDVMNGQYRIPTLLKILDKETKRKDEDN